MNIAALFVRKNSVYKSMAGVDAWDKERDARKWPGGSAIVAHPPCAQWGRMSQWAHKKPAEKRLALLALDLVDRWGGVVEHPVTSRLWAHIEGRKGFLYTIDQLWFGHRACKRTTLYINGIRPREIPPIRYEMMEPTQPVQNMGKAERERTPPAFAEWLIEVARRCSKQWQNGHADYCVCPRCVKPADDDSVPPKEGK